MNGYPKHIATKADIENLLADPGYKAGTLARLQTLLDERYGWVLQGQLDAGYSAEAEAGHKIVTVSNAEGIEKYLYKWGTETFAIDRIGLTVSDAVAWGCIDRAVAAPAE